LKKLMLMIFCISSVMLFAQEEAVWLDVPYFGQGLEWPWGGDTYGEDSPEWVRINLNGCSLASSAMVMAYYGLDTDPGQLNHWLAENNGYAPGWWNGQSIGNTNLIFGAMKQLDLISDMEYKNYGSEPADIELIKEHIRQGHPVIATVMYEKIYGHCVVIYGFEGDELYILDPIDKKAHSINRDYNVYQDEHGSGPARNILSTVVFFGTPPG
jgi:hypothetical protein